MSPLDGELRRALSDRAVRVEPATDPLAGIERRARSMRRNRIASVAAGVALLAGAGAIAVPAVLDATGTQASPAVVLSPAPPPSPAPSALPAGALDLDSPWELRGTAITASDLGAFTREWQVRHPGAPFTPLFSQVFEPSGQVEVVFVSAGTEQGDLWGVVQATESGPDFPWVQPLVRGTTALAAALPGDEVARLLVVAAPGSRRLAYDDGLVANGNTETVLAPLADGVGTTALQGDPDRDRLRVIGADSALVHDQPAPDLPSQSAEPPTSPAPTSAPASPGSAAPPTTASPTFAPAPAAPPPNAVTWPLRGSLAAAPDLEAARRAFATGLGGDLEDLGFRPLLAVDFDGGLRLVAGQAWLRGGQAHSVSYAVGGSCPASTFIGAPTPDDAGVLAFALSCVPGRTTDTVMVVPQPQTGQVSYGAEGSEYRPLEFLPGLEPVVELERDASPARGTDRLQVLDGDGDLDDPVYDGPLDALLCGIKECG